MRARCLSLLLSSCVLTFFVSPTWGQENAMPEISFRCDRDRDIPLTVAQNKAGQTENIFVWQEDILEGKTTNSAEQLCHNVARKLDEYSHDDEANLSSFYLSAQEYSGIPIICVGSHGGCSLVLLVLKKSEDNIDSHLVLDGIIAPKIKRKHPRCRRGCSFTGYKVDFFSDK